MAVTVDRSSISIVFVGQFNPVIFSPEWLRRMEVVSADNLDAAAIEVIHRALSKFSVGEFSIEVTEGRFVITSESEPFVMVQDTVSKIFGEHLKHTHLHQMGINYHETFTLPNIATREKLGRQLAPIEPWGEFGLRMESDNPKLLGGMSSLEMQEFICRHRSDTDFRKVSITASRTPDPFCSVSMRVNDHYNPVEESPENNSQRLIDILNLEFENSIRQAKLIVGSMKTYAEALT